MPGKETKKMIIEFLSQPKSFQKVLTFITEGEPIYSHEIFDKLISKKTITQEEEESELNVLVQNLESLLDFNVLICIFKCDCKRNY